MKKITLFLIFLTAAAHIGSAQQIKRWTFSSQGRVRTVGSTARVSWSAGTCPGCNVLSPTGNPSAGYLRQGFQQPPEINNNSAQCAATPLAANFNITPFNTPTCGTKFDFEFTGQSYAGMTLLWDFGDGAFPRTSTQLNPMGVIYGTAGQKSITLTVRLGTNCRDSKARTVNVSPTQIGFTAAATVADVKCFGQRTGGITVTTSGGMGNKTFTWSNGATTQSITNVTAGRYVVTATDAGGCQFVFDTLVRQPQANLGFRDSITLETCVSYADGSIFLTPTGGTKPYRFAWSNSSTDASIDSLVKGSYRVTITDSNSCRIDTVFNLRRRCDDSRIGDTLNKKLFDVITPNGDGKNDTWVIDGINKYPKHEVFIYNRWGQLIYSTRDYNNTWTGTNTRGDEVPSAAYFYVIQLNNDKQEVWTGSVTIVR
jgi:gliding motility-associated-like protein